MKEKDLGFIEIPTNTDKVKIEVDGNAASRAFAAIRKELPASNAKTETKTNTKPESKTKPKFTNHEQPASLMPDQVSDQKLMQPVVQSTALKNFEEYEQMENEKHSLFSILNFKKHIRKFKARRANKVKKDKFTKRMERAERRRNKLPKLKKLPPIEDAKRYTPSVAHGLTDAQVTERMQSGYYNAVLIKTTKSYWNIFLTNIFNFFNILCFLVAAALITVRAYRDLLFVPLFIINMGIAIWQEIRAKRAVEKISLLTAPTATAVRDGQKIDIPVDKIVLDDILVFALGKQVCADSIIVSGEVEVNESLLTGESIAIKKKAGDVLFAGSFISSGKCIARADKIGEYNYSSTLVSKAQRYKKRKSELLHSVQLVIRVIGFIIIPLGALIYLTNQKTLTVSAAVAKTAGSIMAMIPAGMYLLTTLALAVGVLKLARKRTLVQDLYSIEMLSRVDVICLDKTGTITDGTMKINSVLQIATTPDVTLHDIVGSMLTALDDNNQTSLALASHFGYSKELESVATLPFSSSRKLSAVSFNIGKSIKTYSFGAPEFVLKSSKDATIDKMVKQYAAKGFRVLVVAQGNGKIDKDKLPANMSAVALIVIEDRIREKAPETLKWFSENGVGVKVISGDNPLTVSEVSRRVGVPNADKFISLEGLTKQQVVEAANKYTVFGRVNPDQKSILVRALKAEGKKVAMTGDGVNDILALKEADCSIAMASGSEAARNVSQVVLLDSNFTSMPNIVAEGRRVINNISKSSALFLMKTFFAIFISFLCVISKVAYPFSPNQLLLLESFVVGIPSFVLALQPNKDPIKGNFLYNMVSKALPGAVLFTIGVVTCYVYSKISGIPTDPNVEGYKQFVTMAAYVLIFTGYSILYRLCKPLDIVRALLLIFSLTCIILGLTIFPIDFFYYERLSFTNILAVIVFVQLAYTFYNGVVLVTEYFMRVVKHRSFNVPFRPASDETHAVNNNVVVLNMTEGKDNQENSHGKGRSK